LAIGYGQIVTRATFRVIQIVQCGYDDTIIGVQSRLEFGSGGERHEGGAKRVLAASELLSQTEGHVLGKFDGVPEIIAAKGVLRTFTAATGGDAIDRADGSGLVDGDADVDVASAAYLLERSSVEEGIDVRRGGAGVPGAD